MEPSSVLACDTNIHTSVKCVILFQIAHTYLIDRLNAILLRKLLFTSKKQQ